MSFVSFFVFFKVLVLFPSDVSLLESLIYIDPIRMTYKTRYLTDAVFILDIDFIERERLISVNATICSWERSASLSRITNVSLK